MSPMFGGLSPDSSPWPSLGRAVVVADDDGGSGGGGGGGGGTYETGLPVVASTLLTFVAKGIVSRTASRVVAGKVAFEPEGTVTTSVVVLVTFLVLRRDAGHSTRPVDKHTRPVNVTSSLSVVVIIPSFALASSIEVGVGIILAAAVPVTDLAHSSARVV